MSALRSLLVHIDDGARCASRLLYAQALAQLHEAKLTALYATTPPVVELSYLYAASAVAPMVLREMHLERHRSAKLRFDETLAGRGAGVSWAEILDDPIIGSFAEHARYADLVVLGQHDPGDPLALSTPADFAESVLAASGRPALIIPYVGAFTANPGRVLVAWKASAESARALSAALPLLERARHVDVVAWDDVRAARCDGECLDLEQFLALHGVKPTMHRYNEPAPAEIGEMLLSKAADLGAELLVMGCYGHSRAREFVLGGATRTVLRSMTLPVLMSH